MKQETVKVISLMVSNTSLRLYLSDGTYKDLEQGKYDTKGIINICLPQIEEQGFAYINSSLLVLQSEDAFVKNTLETFQKKSGFKIVSVATNLIKKLFSAKEPVKETDSNTTSLNPEFQRNYTNILQEIEKHSVALEETQLSTITKQRSINDTDTSNKVDLQENTLVAVTDKGVVPHVELTVTQMAHDNKKDSIGFTKLLERLSAMSEKRGHTVTDVIHFLELADLPITDKGDIVAYKLVKKDKGQDDTENYVDCYSGSVVQNVGTRVSMDVDLVDSDRYRECSVGLHIARRDYLGAFYGDACFLVVVEPENIIAIPHGDVRKIRVSSYDIMGVLTLGSKDQLMNNQPIVDESDLLLLSKIVAGNYTPITTLVHISAGKKITRTTLNSVESAPQQVEKEAKVKPIKPISNKQKQYDDVPVIDVVQTVTKRDKFRQLANNLYSVRPVSDEDFNKLKSMRKELKASWYKLGLQEDVAKYFAEVETYYSEMKDFDVVASHTPKPVKQEIIEYDQLSKLELFKLVQDHSDVRAAKKLWEMKKKQKKSWVKLGLPEDADSIMNQYK